MPDSDQCLSAKISGEKDFDLLRASVVGFGFWLWLRFSVFLRDLCGEWVLRVASISVYQRKSAVKRILTFSVPPWWVSAQLCGDNSLVLAGIFVEFALVSRCVVQSETGKPESL